jgi:hypothetical protein
MPSQSPVQILLIQEDNKRAPVSLLCMIQQVFNHENVASAPLLVPSLQLTNHPGMEAIGKAVQRVSQEQKSPLTITQSDNLQKSFR